MENVTRDKNTPESLLTLAARKNEQQWLWAALDEAIKALPEKYQRLVRLYFYEGCTQQQIAALMQVEQSTISRWLAKALAALKYELE